VCMRGAKGQSVVGCGGSIKQRRLRMPCRERGTHGGPAGPGHGVASSEGEVVVQGAHRRLPLAARDSKRGGG
jgi:hypothetical protein